jgi:hypothetical protein
MFGSFSETSLQRYAEQVREKVKKVKSVQGTEWASNDGVSEEDSSFIDNDESYDKRDYAEYDYVQCLRSDGSTYGIADGKKCRKGSKTKAQPKVPSAKDKKREGIRKRGERAVTRAKAEKVLEDLAKEGKVSKSATERRKKEGGGNREEQVRRLAGKVFVEMDKLRQRAKKMKDGQQKEKVLAKVERLKELGGRLSKEQKRLREQAPKAKGENFGKLPSWADTGKQLG